MNAAYLRRTRYKTKVKDWFNDYKSHCVCLECSCTESNKLHFHHLDPSEKETKINSLVQGAYSIVHILKEIEKCVVLCEECHIKAHAVDYYKEGYEWIAATKMTSMDWHAPQDIYADEQLIDEIPSDLSFS